MNEKERTEVIERDDLISKSSLLRSLKGNVLIDMTAELEEEIRRQPTAPGIGFLLQRLEQKATEAEEMAERYRKGGNLGMMVVHGTEASVCRSTINSIKHWNYVG